MKRAGGGAEKMTHRTIVDVVEFTLASKAQVSLSEGSGQQPKVHYRSGSNILLDFDGSLI